MRRAVKPQEWISAGMRSASKPTWTCSVLSRCLIESNCTRLKLELKRVKGSEFEVWTGGISLWRTSEDDRDTGIKTLRNHLLLVVQTSTHPTPVLPG